MRRSSTRSTLVAGVLLGCPGAVVEALTVDARSHLRAAAEAPESSPLDKVIDMITKLRGEVQQEGQDEAGTYDTFACFCKSKSKAVGDDITAGRDSIDLQAATIEEKSSEKDEIAEELMETKANREQSILASEGDQGRCSKAKSEFQRADADISRAIAALQNAMQSLHQVKAGDALLTMHQEVRKQKEVDDAMKVLEDGESSLHATALALLQEHAAVEARDPLDKYRSQGLVEMMTKVAEQFRAKKQALGTEFGKGEQVCQDQKDAGASALLAMETKIGELTTRIDGHDRLLGAQKSGLLRDQTKLKDSQIYLKDLSRMCEQRAADWDQRAKLRAEELTNLSKALAVLAQGGTTLVQQPPGTDAGEEEEEEPATGASPEPQADPSFLQRAAASQRRLRHHDEASALRHATRAAAPQQAAHMRTALDLLQAEGRRLGSASLAALVLRTSGDRFSQVTEVIQKLIERLVHESTQEASKKGFCDTQMGTLKNTRDSRMENTMKIDAEMTTLEAKRHQLTYDLGELSTSLNQLVIDIKDAEVMRKSEQKENMRVIKSAKETQATVSEAITILQVFYKSAAKAFVQEAQGAQLEASPVEADTAGPGFEGAYQGKATAGTGIVNLLQVIESQAERTAREAQEEEREAAAKYEEFAQAGAEARSGSEAKQTLSREDLQETEAALSAATTSLKENQHLVDVALQGLEELKPLCVDTSMSAAQRHAKREEEISALRRALCMLDVDGVESACRQDGGQEWMP